MKNTDSSSEIIVTNPLRVRLAAIFALPYPLSSLIFRYYIGRLIPIYKTLSLEPLVLKQDEVVVALNNRKKLRFFGKIVHPAALYALAQAAVELGLLYNLEGIARISLEKMDMIFEKEVTSGIVARTEWTDKEILYLRESNGTIQKGVALVDEDNQLCGKAVFQFRWKKLK